MKASKVRMQRQGIIFISLVIIGLLCYCFNANFNYELHSSRKSQPLKNNLKLNSNKAIKSYTMDPLVTNNEHEIDIILKKIRNHLLSEAKDSDKGQITLLPPTILNEADPQYFEKIKKFSCVTTLSLKWQKINKKFSELRNSTNHRHRIFNDTDVSMEAEQWLLIKKYYPFTASEPLCKWIITGDINYRYGYVYNYTCNTKFDVGNAYTGIEPLYLNSRTPSNYDVGLIQPLHRFEMPTAYHAMQIFTKAIISGMGEPFCNGVQVKPDDCLPAPSSRPNSNLSSTFPFYEEIFVISQRWGEGYFHRMIEDVPRVALFLVFLLRYPNIKILAYDKSKRLLDILQTLGLSADRVITGWARASTAYVPRSTSCGTPNMIELQLFHRYNSKFITENLLKGKKLIRNKLILIKRSGRRKFTDYNLIEKLLKETCFGYGLEFELFRDNPPPSLNDTMVMFSLASVVVAPHGAGLSNLVYSRPGTLVIEGVCNKPIVNLCYQRTAYALGMRWHGIPSLRGCEDVVDVSGEIIDQVLREYLRIIPMEELQ